MDRGRLSPCPFLPRRFNTGRGRVMAFWKSGSPGIHAGNHPPPPPKDRRFPSPMNAGIRQPLVATEGGGISTMTSPSSPKP